jgi:hypothetical protein
MIDDPDGAGHRVLFDCVVRERHAEIVRNELQPVAGQGWPKSVRDGSGDCVDIPSTNDSLENVDPFVTLHFDVVTAGRLFIKAGLVAVTERLLGKLWILALSPWMISVGVLPLSQARQILADVYKIWDTTSEPKFQSRFSTDEWLESSASQTVQ